jgi:hypothetical protein
VAVSIESMNVAPAPVGTELLILRASLVPPPPPDEQWWWLREVRQRMPALRGLAALSGGTETFEIQIETRREELEASTGRFRDALSAAIAARPVRYAADRRERDAEVTALRIGEHAPSRPTRPSSTV